MNTVIPDQGLTLRVPVYGEWMSSNLRLHWAEKARRTRIIRWRANALARETHLPKAITERVLVIAKIGYATARRADPANAEPVVKALLDGLTDYGLWADDNSEHVLGPLYDRHHERAEKGSHFVEITIIPAASAGRVLSSGVFNGAVFGGGAW